MTFLLDLGIEKRDGELCFEIETARNGLKPYRCQLSFQTRAAN